MLLPNVRKILLIAGLDEQASDALLEQLQQVQEARKEIPVAQNNHEFKN